MEKVSGSGVSVRSHEAFSCGPPARMPAVAPMRLAAVRTLAELAAPQLHDQDTPRARQDGGYAVPFVAREHQSVSNVESMSQELFVWSAACEAHSAATAATAAAGIGTNLIPNLLAIL